MASMLPRNPPPSIVRALSPEWKRTWLLLGLTLALTAAAFWQSVVSILHNWSSNPFGHGYFVVPTVAYLVWKRRDRLHALPPEASLAGLALTAAGAFAWLVGTLTATEILQEFAWFVVVVGLIWAITGRRAISILLFPLGLLPLALPLFDRIVPFLQNLTAWNAVALLKLFGVPVLLQGHVIVLPASSWEVAQACSGINYVLTTLVMGYVYAGVVYRTTRNRVVFLLACIVDSAPRQQPARLYHDPHRLVWSDGHRLGSQPQLLRAGRVRSDYLRPAGDLRRAERARS